MRIEKIQIEPTTACNLDCRYCFRTSANIFTESIDMEIVEKVRDVAGEYVIYGFGEPLLNERMSEIMKILKTFDGKITVSTNGVVDNKRFREVVEIADRVGISLDLNSEMRRGFRFDEVIEKLRILEKSGNGFLEVVVTADNLRRMPEIADIAESRNLALHVSNMIAPSKELYDTTLYLECSRFVVDAIKDAEEEMGEEIDEKFIEEVIREHSAGRGRKLDVYRKLLDYIYGSGYSMNLLKILENRERIERALRAEKVFKELKEKREVKITAPSFFGDDRGRECPYEKTIFVRADGKVSSCMSFAYTHNEFINSHSKKVNEFLLGDLKSQEIDDVLEALSDFEISRENMEFPWCADCPYVDGCWYARENLDCYGNLPSCSECLYSCGIARCLQ